MTGEDGKGGTYNYLGVTSCQFFGETVFEKEFVDAVRHTRYFGIFGSSFKLTF